MRVHILGVCGTFMGGIAAIAKEAGHDVSGADQNVYPPMSTQLAGFGIKLVEGYEAPIDAGVESVVVGNALSRGKPVVEALLNSGRPYSSGPQWLAEHVLRDQWVLAVSGTHGKTTTTSMLAWILEYAGLNPGFLVGGVPTNFGISARLGGAKYFVVEADEYDTAFFDKRAKFVHYRPRTLIVNNIEFDHADIYSDIDAIIWQFHQLLRTVPGNGLIVANGKDANIERFLQRGVWTPLATFSATTPRRAGSAATIRSARSRASAFSSKASRAAAAAGRCSASTISRTRSRRSRRPATSALRRETALRSARAVQGRQAPARAARHVRRHQLVRGFRASSDGDRDDAAGLRSRAPQQRIVAVMEPRSNTMRMGVHRDTLHGSFAAADRVFVLGAADLGWDPAAALRAARRALGRRRRRAGAACAAARRARGRRSRRADVERQLSRFAAAARASARRPDGELSRAVRSR